MANLSARKGVREYGNPQVPLRISNEPTKLKKEFRYGKEYKYAQPEDSPGKGYPRRSLKEKNT